MEKSYKDKKIILVGGHLTPALAVHQELINQGFNNITWVGTKYAQTHNRNHSIEYDIVRRNGIKFVNLRAGKLWRKLTIKTIIYGLQNLFLIPFGFVHSFLIILKYKPSIVVSFGGHLALPMIICAKLLFVSTMTHEQTIVTGLTNKIISKFSDVVCISWKNSKKYFDKRKTVLTGLPINNAIFSTNKDKSLFNNSKPVLFVVGGNQGSNTINWRLLVILEELLKEFNIIHLTGNSTITKDFEKALEAKAKLNENLTESYMVLASADIVLCRSGANTVSEILAKGKLSILIPIPWSSNHEQLRNAQMLEENGLGLIIEQHDNLKPETILEKIMLAKQKLQSNQSFKNESIETAIRKSRSKVNENASANIVAEISTLLN